MAIGRRDRAAVAVGTWGFGCSCLLARAGHGCWLGFRRWWPVWGRPLVWRWRTRRRGLPGSGWRSGCCGSIRGRWLVATRRWRVSRGRGLSGCPAGSTSCSGWRRASGSSAVTATTSSAPAGPAAACTAAAGHDLIHGFGGHDRLHGGHGHDLIHGGGGHDRIVGGRGHDLIRGGPGHDRLHGGPATTASSTGREHGRDHRAGNKPRRCRRRQQRPRPLLARLDQQHRRRPRRPAPPPLPQPSLHRPLRAAQRHNHNAQRRQKPVTGDGTNDDPYIAPCDNEKQTDCVVSSFPARSLTGLWANEYVPAYKCPTSHPYLYARTTRPLAPRCRRASRSSGLGPIGVSITGTLTVSGGHSEPLVI